MEILPHIDIIEPARIDAIFADEGNFCWRAIDSETLDSWTPDLGLTGYQRPSVYRPGAVATSGIASTLRHRFWQTVQNQADHTGSRYIGILIYCAAGEACPMDLQLASQVLGRVEPQRHDNRRHLIVVDRPVEFIGEMEIFRLTAPGKGVYRIEAFALLHKRPTPCSFAPEIENLSCRTVLRDDGAFDAHLHWTTSRAARIELAIEADGYHARQEAAPSRLHHLVFDGLPAQGHFRASLRATEAGGDASTAQLSFSTFQAKAPPVGEVTVPLDLLNPAGAPLGQMPLSFGIPFARGALHAIQSCQLRAGGETLPATTRPLSRWDDGSLRWALVESATPSALNRESALPVQVHVNRGAAPAEPAPKLRLMADDAGQWRVEQADSGRWRPALSADELYFETTLANGMALQASPARLLSRSADRLRFAVDHQDAHGVAHLRSLFSLRLYPGQSFLVMRHRLEVISPSLAPAQGGDLPESHDSAMRANIVGGSGEESSLLKLRSFALTLPFAGASKVASGAESWTLDGAAWQLRHDHDLEHQIGGETRSGRALGQLRVEGNGRSIGLGLARFWQTYPKALAVDERGLHFQLFPERRGVELPGDADAWHRLYFWLDEAGYKLKAGMALSSDILLNFGADDAACFAWLEGGALARLDLEHLNGTGVLNAIGARGPAALPRYDAMADLALQSLQDDRENHRAYGHINFGDWYGESQWSWGNNEYDPSFVGYCEFLRGGQPGWARWAADAARHLADVDTINFSADPSQIGGQAMHIAGHLGGYLRPYFRSKMGGTSAGPAHMWVEGPALHYLLTGDELVHESLLKTRDWLTQKTRLDAYEYKSARDAGWHLIHLAMLAEALDDRLSLNAARIIIERVLERQSPDGGWNRMLGEPHCGCGYPRCQGEAGFMICILISGLKRCHRLTGDQAVAEAIIGGARWLIRSTFDSESGHFRYTSCANRSLGGNFQCTQWVMEGLSAAWELSGDREIGRYLREGLKTIGMFPGRLSHLGVGKAMAQKMRYVPAILAALETRPLEDLDD